MENTAYLSWVEFYSAFTKKLLVYSKDRKTLIAKMRSIYKAVKLKFPKVDSSDDITNIDPFTIFGFFNKGISEANRIAILSGIAREFSIDVPVPECFDGIPVANNLNATFYPFTNDPNHGEHDIDNLWRLFETALSFADNATKSNKEAFITAYNRVKKIKNNRWKLTMGLFWIRPMKYINLDSRNRSYIEKSQELPSECITLVKDLSTLPMGIDYIHICDTFFNVLQSGKYEYKNFPELSHQAWLTFEKRNQEDKVVPNQIHHNNTNETDLNEEADGIRYWVYTPGGKSRFWEEFRAKGIMGIGWEKLGNLEQYHSKQAIKNKLQKVYGNTSSYVNDGHTLWQFIHNVKEGDVIYVKKGLHEIIGRGIVTSGYRYDDSRKEYKNIRTVQWGEEKKWHNNDQLPMKTLTEITRYTELCQNLEDFFSEEEVAYSTKPADYPFYTSDDFLNEVFMEEEQYEKFISALKRKKNVIIEGPPGVGKTFCVKRLAWSMMNEKDKSRVTMIQFHQSYGYEDFIMGYRPTRDGFELKRGPFYEFCKKAEDDEDRDYFFIIDEINRGNMSRIFGELLMLIESDKRGHELRLLYANELFSVPKNLFLIGLMNTADRSLAMIDYALRRRFAFFHFDPAFDTRLFHAYQENLHSHLFDSLIQQVVCLNREIKGDPSLGDGFQIGHSYFSNFDNTSITSEELHTRLDDIVEYELIPLLKEYWFDDQEKVQDWSARLRSVMR